MHYTPRLSFGTREFVPRNLILFCLIFQRGGPSTKTINILIDGLQCTQSSQLFTSTPLLRHVLQISKGHQTSFLYNSGSAESLPFPFPSGWNRWHNWSTMTLTNRTMQLGAQNFLSLYKHSTQTCTYIVSEFSSERQFVAQINKEVLQTSEVGMLGRYQI